MAEATVTAEERAILERLQRVAGMARKILAAEMGSAAGSKSSFGSGTLFYEHRRYSSGDDPRTIDWNAYARLDELFVRRFEPEDASPITILLDGSPSMRVAGADKETHAADLAAAFGAIGVLVLAGATIVRAPSGDEAEFTGKGSLVPMIRFVRPRAPSGSTSMAEAVRRAARRHERGLLVLATDGVPIAHLDAALHARGRHSALVLHVVDATELRPPVAGLARLVDPESGRARTIFVTRSLRLRAIEGVRARLREVEALARRAHVAYLRVSTSTPFDAAVVSALRGGLVTGRFGQ